MNEKQAKLLRYFTKHTGDKHLAEQTAIAWPYMTARARGKISTWMKKVIVTMMAVKDAREKHEEQKKIIQAKANMDVLKGFAS